MKTIEKTVEMNAAQKAATLTSALRNFCGTETWFRHPFFPKYLYTEGIQFLAEEAGCYWLIDLIYGLQCDQQAVRNEAFQVWDLIVGENKAATLQCEDGNGNVIFVHRLNYTTFPLEKIRLYFSENVLLLTTEW